MRDSTFTVLGVLLLEHLLELFASGFTIYSVSLDSDKDKWLTAIDKDGLGWYHVSDLAGWRSQAAVTYQVRSIPATYLIDPEGRIIAKNLRGARLSKVLNEIIDTSGKTK